MRSSLRCTLAKGFKKYDLLEGPRRLSTAIDLEGINISSDKAVSRKERHTNYKVS